MLRDDARQRVQNTLGFRTDRADEIVDALRDAQVNLEQEPVLPWFLKTEVTSQSTTDGEERVVIPPNFLRENDEDALWYFNASATDPANEWTPLAKDELEILRETHPGSGSPLAYHLDDLYFRIFPTPDAAYLLKIIHYKEAAVLTSNIENDWLKYFPYLMIGEAGRLIAPGFRDAQGKATFDEWAIQGRERMLRAVEAREHAGQRYIMGGPD
jgi:hypothetical protein